VLRFIRISQSHSFELVSVNLPAASTVSHQAVLPQAVEDCIMPSRRPEEQNPLKTAEEVAWRLSELLQEPSVCQQLQQPFLERRKQQQVTVLTAAGTALFCAAQRVAA
jgi:hypothetical protein